MTRSDGRVAIITGGARGQGAATVRAFVAAGMRVIVCDLGFEERGPEGDNDGILYRKLDVRDVGHWKAVTEEALDRWGKIDVLVNNAGIAQVKPLLEIEPEEFEALMRVNVVGSFLGIKSVAPTMIKQASGSIINIVSMVALVATNGVGAYSSSKWALRGLTKSAALELGPYGIRVNAIFPGAIDTPMTNPDGRPAADMNAKYAEQPIQRAGRPDEIADVTLFLASDAASYMTGAELAVDGGATTGRYMASLPGGLQPNGSSAS